MPIDFEPIKSGIDFQPIENTSTDNIDFKPIKSKVSSIGETLGRIATLPVEPLQHPEYLTQTVPESLGGKSPKEVIVNKYGMKKEGENWKPAFIRASAANIAGEVANIATTPLSYVPLPAGKLIGKIPFKGTTVGEIATKLPIGDVLKKDVAERVAYQTALKDLPQRVASSQAPLQAVKQVIQPIDPITKITQVLQEAKPIRGKQEELYTAERAKRIGKVVETGEKVSGEAGYFAQLGALKGELPKVEFEGIRNKIVQTDIDSLFNSIEVQNTLTPWEKITAKTGLSKLLGKTGGVVPTEGELKLLSEVFPKDFIKAVYDKQPLLQKVGQGVAEVLNVPRALMASFDMSVPLRQGAFLVGRPKQWLPAFGDMVKSFFSEKSYQGLMDDIQKRPTYNLMRQSGLPITNIGGSLTSREEVFMSNLPQNIPILGNVVKASNRAYTGFLNKLRADVFDDLISSAQKQGINIEGKVANDIATFVGSATGRGKLGALESSAIALNSVFFSPRLMASRLNLLNPIYYTKLDPFVRKEALKSLFTFAGTGMSILTLAKMGGAEVGVDPRNADFGKMKIGNTRYDPWGGFQQYIRVASQLMTGQLVNSTTGVVATTGEGYKPITRLDILSRFVESKTAPVTSFAIELLKGQTQLGLPVDLKAEIAQRFIPMVLQDMSDLYQERGFEGLPMGIPAVFGVGVQTYAPTPAEVVRSMNSVISNVKRFLKEGRTEEAKNLMNRNMDTLQKGRMFEPVQKVKTGLTNLKETINQNVLIPSEQKTNKIKTIDKKLETILSKEKEQQETLKKHGSTVTTIDSLLKSSYFQRIPNFMKAQIVKGTVSDIDRYFKDNPAIDFQPVQ